GEAALSPAPPDLPLGLAAFYDAFARFAARSDAAAAAGHRPPAGLLPDAGAPARTRAWHRSRHDDRALPTEVRAWAGELLVALGQEWRRLEAGVPPVTEAEAAELARWLEDNVRELAEISRSSGWLLDFGDGRRVVPSHLRQGHYVGGPRDAYGVAEVCDQLRRLRARYGPALAAQ